MSKSHMIIPIFVSHEGCPFDCVFCNQKKITGCSEKVTGEVVHKKVKEYLKTMDSYKDKHIEIAFFGGSFTGIDQAHQKELLEVANQFKKQGMIKDIRLSTRPDYISHEQMKFLVSLGVSIIELGVQSMDDEVLFKSGRGHTSLDVENAVKIIRQYPIQLGLQMMIGLVGDCAQKDYETAEQFIKLSPDFVRIYPTLVVKDTNLEKLYLKKIYCPLSLSEGVEIAKEIFKKFIKNKIPVIRIGLQPTENIILGKEVIAGPFHPSFRQLVESKIYQEVLKELFIKHHIKNIHFLKINLHPKDISLVVGQKRSNIEFIKENYNIKNVKIIPNPNIKPQCVHIEIDDVNEVSMSVEEYVDNAI